MVKKRPYDHLDLEELMDNCGGRSRSWSDVVARTRADEAPDRILGVLGAIDKKRYPGMPDVLEAVGDKTWDHN